MKIDNIFRELIQIFLEFNVEELKAIKKEWYKKIKDEKIDENAITVCMRLCDAIIRYKIENV